ncbi:hypothetical protein [Jannaschia sp. W003]|uniref:hypothetical protein n=1 Tax=Jannaschia sp. W003 TaxID=2867012 RepID=UPI0021A53E2A|nr:hypothetical protein [Jannaschia sp. W003]UWQ22701.1 hypothetical protein K3554_06660 [Jannaschia sp. W003]
MPGLLLALLVSTALGGCAAAALTGAVAGTAVGVGAAATGTVVRTGVGAGKLVVKGGSAAVGAVLP